MTKTKLKDTKVGSWLKQTSPRILDLVGHLLPDKGVLGVVKNMIDKEPNISHEQRMELQNLIASQQQELTKRWESDNKSDSWLAKHTRPLIVLSLVAALFGSPLRKRGQFSSTENLIGAKLTHLKWLWVDVVKFVQDMIQVLT